MLTTIEAIVFSIVLALTVYAFFQPLYFRFKLIRSGQPEKRFDRPFIRFFIAIKTFFMGFLRMERPVTGFIHIFILYGSLTFDTVSIGHIIEGFNSAFHISSAHLLVADIFAILVIIAVIYFMIKRYIFRPKSYTFGTPESLYIYLLLLTVTLTFLLYEGAVIAHNPASGTYSFIGKQLAAFVPGSIYSVKLWWWIHILNVFLFVAYVPRSKYQHMFMAPINGAFQSWEPVNTVRKLDLEDEKKEQFGVSTLTDFTWKDLLDGFACIDCGRCEDYCPASQSDKKLSPKNIILFMRNALLKEGKQIISNNGNGYEAPQLMDGVYTDDEIWACTTCMACVEVCPTKNEQYTKILDVRQSRVLMDSQFPSELKKVFKGMINNQNPWGLGADKRLDWTSGLEVPEFDENTEYLLHVGCAASFDDRSQKIIQSLVRVLNDQNISYGTLGRNEICCGETARRLGEEALGQELVESNIENFKEMKVKKILTACPHCFNVFKNEYPQFNGNYEVIHHSQLLADLVQQGKLKLNKKMQEKVVMHDACYLGRANTEYDAPRDTIGSIPGLKLVEHKQSKRHSHCCGAGGGRFWMEETEGNRVNHNRIKQLSETDASVIATSCPYCMRMLNDGKNDLGKDNIEIKDIVEILETGLSS